MYLGSGFAVYVCFALPRLSYPLIKLTVTSLFSCGLISIFIEYLCWHWFNMILDGDCCIGECCFYRIFHHCGIPSTLNFLFVDKYLWTHIFCMGCWQKLCPIGRTGQTFKVLETPPISRSTWTVDTQYFAKLFSWWFN